MKTTNEPIVPSGMEDEKIIDLYWARNEKAIEETDKKYGKYLYTIAYNIVHNHLDCEECVNDTYLGTWNRIPPARPTVFQAFLSKIARNISVDRFRLNSAEKRIPSELTVSLDELDGCIAYDDTVDRDLLIEELAKLLNDTLSRENDRRQYVFICRYYYADSIAKIAKALGLSEKTISRDLAQVRANLKAAFEKGGYHYGTKS